MNRPEIIEKIKKLLQKLDPTAEVIVYGSEARGDARENSDIDLLILVNKEKLTFEDITYLTYPLYDLEITDGITVSPLVYTRKSWENRPFLTPFYLNVMNESVYETTTRRQYVLCIYNAVIALLVKNNIVAQTYQGVKQMFGLHFIATGKIANKYSRFYSQLFNDRISGDYDDFLVFDKEQLTQIRPLAEDFIAVIEELLKK